MTKRSAIFVQIRQICSTGLPPEVIIPAVIDEVAEAIPHTSCMFYWATQKGEIERFWCNKLESEQIWNAALEIGKCLDRFQLLHSVNFASGYFPEWAHLVRNEWLMAIGCNKEPHDFGHKQLIDGIVHDGKRSYGFFTMLRTQPDGAFSQEEREVVRALLPCLLQALKGENRTPCEYAAVGRSGIVVLNEEGVLLEWSGRARELMLMAADRMNPTITPIQWASAIGGIRGYLPESLWMTSIWRDSWREPPVTQHSNRWGKFCFRGHRMENSESAGLRIGVYIEHHIPLELELLRRIKRSPLSAKQKEVCWLIARGLPSHEILESMRISYPTLKEHQQAIYNKLQVSNREHLIRHMLSGHTPALH